MLDGVVIVTGAAGSLGRAVTDSLLSAGCTVAGVDAVAFERAGMLAIGGVDIADPEVAETIVKRFADALGPITGLVNIAGTFRWETVAQGDVATWDLLYRVNLRTVFAMSQAVLARHKEGELAIVNVGAAAAVKADAGMGAYAASKAGVARLTESLAQENKDRGVRVNAVLPSIIDTPANRADMPEAEFDRWVQPAALGDVILFLLSDRARAITGANIPVAGRV
jgi:NAD(P)-dependent dehydrogenase (short-subunit alcohol dehydrogenase family)